MEVANQMVYFICPDLNLPTGGIKQIYRQVDVMNNHGFKASVLHRNFGFRCDWFENNTVISYNTEVWSRIEPVAQNYKLPQRIYHSLTKKLRLVREFIINNRPVSNCIISDEDILVFPEIYGFEILDLFPNNNVVIYNQNCFYTFNKYNFRDVINTSFNNLKATIVASEYAFDYVRLFSEKVYKVKYGFIKTELNIGKKEKIISFMPRKLKNDVTQVIQLIKKRGNISDTWQWMALDGMSELEVQESLEKSAFFLSFSDIEGFGMPPAEAMLSCCVVIGYHGLGGREYFNSDLCINIPDRDILCFVNELEKHLNLYDFDASVYQQMGARASAYISNNYNIKEEEKTIIKAWTEIFQNDL